MQQSMLWSADNTPISIQGKSLKLRELFARTANAAIAKGLSRDEAIFAASNAVKSEEKKNQPAKTKAKTVASFTSPFEVVSKAAEDQDQVPQVATVKAAEFDAQGHLVLLMTDGKRIVTKGKAVSQNIEQVITIAAENKATSTFTVMKEPTGFDTRTTSTISFDDSTRTFSITATNPIYGFDVWLNSKQKTYYSEQIQIPDESKIHFIYFNCDLETLESTTVANEALFLDCALVALVYWRADQQKSIYFGDERHGLRMDGATHAHLHLSIGAQYRTGLGLTNFTVDANGSLNSHAQFGCENGVIADEDITISIIDDNPQNISTIANLPVFYRIGTADNWYRKEADVFPLIRPSQVSHYTGTVRPAYNYFNGTQWVLSEVVTNNFILMHILATNDIRTPIVAVVGNSYNTKTNARAASLVELKDMQGLPFLEFVKLGTVIYESSTSYANTPKARIVSTEDALTYVDHRTSLHSLVIF